MKTCVLALWGDSLTYTITKALSFVGHDVLVWIADTEKDRQSSWSLTRRIASIPRVTVASGGEVNLPESIDQLVIQGHTQLLQHRDALDLLALRSSRLTMVSSGDRSRTYRRALKIQLREMRWYGRRLAKVARVAYKDGFYPIDLLGIFKSRRVVGFDVHSKFLQDSNLFQAIHAADWDAETRRPILVNFVGSQDPATRTQILDSVRHCFTEPADTQPNGSRTKRLFWRAYTDAQPAALKPQDFLQVLSESDFTLCPPGYSLVTHRPLEALLRGSIPVLNVNELDLYDLGLKDGVNCITAPTHDWQNIMERISRFGEEQLIAMRKNILAMLDDRLSYTALSKQICARLGLQG